MSFFEASRNHVNLFVTDTGFSALLALCRPDLLFLPSAVLWKVLMCEAAEPEPIAFPCTGRGLQPPQCSSARSLQRVLSWALGGTGTPESTAPTLLGFHLSSGPLSRQEGNLLSATQRRAQRKTRTAWAAVRSELLCSLRVLGSKGVFRVGQQLRRLTQASHVSVEPTSQCAAAESTGQRDIVDPHSCFSHW